MSSILDEPLPPSSLQPEACTTSIEASSEALDTEMTCPLTLDDQEYTVSPSPSPTNEDKMMFTGRDRSSTNGYGSYQQNIGNGHGHPAVAQLGGFSAPGVRAVPQLPRAATIPEAAPVPRYGSLNGRGNGVFHASSSYDPATPGLMDQGRYRANSAMMPVATPPIMEGMPLDLVNPGPAWPNDHQMSVAYSYGVRNEDGSYTRLIRADDLERFIGYPVAPRQSSEGLIILPPTRVPSPNSRQGNKQQIVPRTVSLQPSSNQNETC